MTPTNAGPQPERTDARVRRVELVISAVLRTGVVASLAVIVFGTVLSFVHHPGYLHPTSDLQRLTGPRAACPHSLGEIGEGLRQWRGQAFVAAGLVLLIATPIMRVAISILAFLYQRDRIFVLVTTTVLALLLLSFVLGATG
ncbi:MAG: DUF1634 domain-containing protein [Planctomycetota bacterium]|nr:DUF1634 domain-containing protein [Planctomycetota bacterium]